MSRNRVCFAIVCLSLLMTWVSPVLGQARSPEKLWDDFNHYVLIARPELAHAAGQALLNQVNDDQLLDIVEASDFADWLDRVKVRADGMPTVAETAAELARRIQAARIARARDVQRIKDDIERLGRGLQARMLATERLRAAGQYAAPHLLEALLDPKRANLHPHILTAMVSIGRPMVYPLSEALPKLEPVPMGQIAQVLAEIGYPMSLPYLKLVLEDTSVDPTARRAVQAAHDQIVRVAGRGQDLNAAETFFLLGLSQYEYGTSGQEIVGYDPAEKKGIVWEYSLQAGLVPIPVPGQVYGDVLAMRSARKALTLDPGMDRALSLWVMANLRRENRLDGERDPSYPSEFQPAAYYALLAGPIRLHEVLSRALADGDSELALDAIAALDQTAGTEALLNLEGTIQPLLQALSFPDRRVRFEAAFALTRARPKEAFPGSYQVVPVLAEAVRQTEQHHAVIISPNQETLNKLQAMVSSLGYDTIAGQSLLAVNDQIRVAPGIDLVLVQAGADEVMAVFNRAAADFKLASIPIVAVTSPAQQFELTARMPNERRLVLVSADADENTMRAALENARNSFAGPQMTSAQASDYAVKALALLRDVALVSGDVYKVTDAQPALMLALNDARDDVVTGAAAVLAMIDNAKAQAAIARLALDTTRSVEIRRAALVSLAESATSFGSSLDERTVRQLQELVANSRGPLAVDAAKAFGALAPATRNAVQLITR